MMQGNGEDIVWLEWLDKVMKSRPSGNILLDSQRGIEGGRLCLELEKKRLQLAPKRRRYFLD